MVKMAQKFEKKEIVKKSKDVSKWYNDVVLKAELADYGPARGTMVIRPYGFALWEKIQAYFDALIKGKEMGVQNAYFPLFIPEKFIEKEKQHVEGFAPHLAVVTIGGGKKLEEKLVVRPTSETIINAFFSKWIKSWRDLPLKINQWCNIVRWEMRTMLFMRTTEFLWQEGHTAHATRKGAREFALKALKAYEKIYQELLAIPVYSGQKSEKERFAGADMTYAVEPLMADGRALQGATSHELGQNFAKAFDISFQDEDGQNQLVWQTSWGISTRSVGALIMVHGDDQGLVLPPRVAPIQVVVIPILDKDKKAVLTKAEQIAKKLEEKGVKVKVDKRETHSLGFKINDWELKGVPLRLEIGQKELAKKKFKLVKRIGSDPRTIDLSETELVSKTKTYLEEIQAFLFQRASQFLKKNTRRAKDYQEFKKIMETERGFIKVPWCERPICEEKIKAETKATSRLLTFEGQKKKAAGKCFACDQKASHAWLFAQAY